MARDQVMFVGGDDGRRDFFWFCVVIFFPLKRSMASWYRAWNTWRQGPSGLSHARRRSRRIVFHEALKRCDAWPLDTMDER
ncbi:hypothetical protein BDP81DRAFT_192627 [Colletotrichum phormii]|uniref:Uncharacterized protein n=1 Tax=Colletotrichum phormii TaxID=359342 RepID=A0AAI9ZW01_9PEZI|nr:uncharacterized protein BDP81DRAFT_192627 [Colletotrichum phormii]KAK1638850.1 hypothetical protein BDP81DRAFT_192627 [Colletotrichum phormii]